MKKIIISIILVLSLLLLITACGHEETIRKMAEAATSMAGQENVKTEAHLWVDTGSDKELTYEDLFAQITDTAMKQTDRIPGEQGNFFGGFNHDIKVDYLFDGKDNFDISLFLPSEKEDDYKRLCRIMLVDNEAYISTDIILSAVESLFNGYAPEEVTDMFSSAEYIKIKSDVISELGMSNISEEDIEEQREAISGSTDKLIAAIKENLPAVITEDLKMVSKKDGYYILSMDEKQALIILNSVIEIIEENTDDVIEFLSGAFPNETIDEEDISELTDSLYAIAESEDWDSIEGNATFAVKGNKFGQEMKFRSEINHSDYDKTVTFGFETKSTPIEESVKAPRDKNTIDLKDILNSSVLNSLMYGGSSEDTYTSDDDIDYYTITN